FLSEETISSPFPKSGKRDLSSLRDVQPSVNLLQTAFPVAVQTLESARPSTIITILILRALGVMHSTLAVATLTVRDTGAETALAFHFSAVYFSHIVLNRGTLRCRSFRLSCVCPSRRTSRLPAYRPTSPPAARGCSGRRCTFVHPTSPAWAEYP